MASGTITHPIDLTKRTEPISWNEYMNAEMKQARGDKPPKEYMKDIGQRWQSFKKDNPSLITKGTVKKAKNIAESTPINQSAFFPKRPLEAKAIGSLKVRIERPPPVRSTSSSHPGQTMAFIRELMGQSATKEDESNEADSSTPKKRTHGRVIIAKTKTNARLAHSLYRDARNLIKSGELTNPEDAFKLGLSIPFTHLSH